MKNKRVTIADLARMVKSGFDFMHEQFARVDQRLERIELRLDHTAARFEVRELEHRVSRLEKKAGLPS